ncbi:hypothetical protein GDO86_004011 [Hymenochirus boettgeri]|uniref:G-protein coupled receptors family 1 profile domain-containing protein n=1 Tax=Hymenochirus boettgeri TaxID=247094 RepID=A0A8T2K6M5_9PIPI|nr:hypothetical protein GDO86_004011 [Hymenochirus boettgeri]
MNTTTPLTLWIQNNSDNQSCDLYSHRNTARIAIPLFYCFVFFFGLFGNLLALMVIYQYRRKMNSTTLYSTNLVLSDILFATALPMRIAYYGLGFHWPFGEPLCRITSLFFYINTYAGVNFMMCLSVDRFFAVVHPNRYHKMRTVKYAKYICVFIWMIVFSQTLPLLFQTMSKKESIFQFSCMEYPNFEVIPHLPFMLLGACFIGYLIPLGIILACYSKISTKLYQITKENALSEKSGTNKKAINTIILIITVFLICFTPYHVSIIQHMIKKLIYTPDCNEQQQFQVCLHITVCLMNLNCCLDPFIYFFACKGYKRKIKQILKRQVSISSSSATRPAAEDSSRDVMESQLMLRSNETGCV